MMDIKRKAKKVIFHILMDRYHKKNIVSEPTFIQLEPTVRCNLDCITCSRPQVINEYKKMDMDIDEIGKIITFFPKLKSIKLQGLGEPLLHPQIGDILKKLVNKNIKVWIISNGTLLNSDKYRNLLVDYVSDVAISIDSVNEENFNYLRKGANLRKITDGIKLLVAERNIKKSNLTIGINFVVSHKNYNEIEKLYDLIVDSGVDYLTINSVENWSIADENGFNDAAEFVAESRKYRQQISGSVKKLFLKLMKKRIVFGHKKPNKRIGKCFWPFKSLCINVEGFVTPCCLRMNKRHSFGNIFQVKSLNEIYNSKEYQCFRNAHIIKDFSNRMCGSCPD